MRFKDLFACGNFQCDQSARRERIHHVQLAAV
jgi:hypothetical protein